MEKRTVSNITEEFLTWLQVERRFTKSLPKNDMKTVITIDIIGYNLI
jgi:hypothetical protein